MNSHDVLAFAIAGEAVARIRAADPDWDVFSHNVHSTSSRSWPLPDFVIVDEAHDRTAAAEFKPPAQTKREYLTGLGQAVAYTRDFDHGLLVLPSVADDGYPIGTHVQEVLDQEIGRDLPVGLLQYDPAKLSPAHAEFEVLRKLEPRANRPASPVAIENSFWAKWREASPQELGLLLEYLYEDGRIPAAGRSIRDRRSTGSGRRWLPGGPAIGRANRGTSRMVRRRLDGARTSAISSGTSAGRPAMGR